jgi:hypothetical protein
MKQINPVHNLKFYFNNMSFILSINLFLGRQSSVIFKGFLTKILYTFLV